MKTELIQCVCGQPAEFQRAQLAPGLPSMTCASCHGHWLLLDDHEKWASSQSDVIHASPMVMADMPVDAEKRVRQCPQCARLMTRLRVGASVNFRVDGCVTCHGLWLDAGEWDAIDFLGLSRRIGHIMSDEWQKGVQDEEAQSRREAQLRLRYGDACMDELVRIRQWLQGQPDRDTLLTLLRNGW